MAEVNDGGLLVQFNKANCTEWTNGRPFHDDEKALLSMVHVFIQAEDPHNVGPSWHPAVQLYLPPCLWTVVQYLRDRKKESERDGKCKREKVCVWEKGREWERRVMVVGWERERQRTTQRLLVFIFFFSGDKLLRAFVIKKRSCKSSCPHVLPKFFPHYFYPFKLVWQRRPLRPCLVLSWLMLPSLCLCKSPHITFRK